MRARTIPVLILLVLVAARGFAAQSFDLAYESFDDRNGNGRINCLEQVTFRVTLLGTGATAGGDRGRITVPFGNPDFWTYLPGSFQLDPILTEACAVSVVSGGGITDPALVLDYLCDPRAANPLDDNYALTFRVAGRFFSNFSSGLGVAARNERTSPSAEVQDDFALSTDPAEPCPPPPDLRLAKSLASGTGTAGATLVYTLTVNNFGGSAADGVVLTENVPLLTTFLPAASSPGWLCLPNNAAGASCTLSLGTVAAGSSVSRSFAVQVDPTLPPNPGTIGNTACVTTETPNDPVEDNCGSTSTPAGSPDLRLNKSVLTGSGTPGATLRYRLSVVNAGTRAAAGVTVQETVPSHTFFQPAASDAGWSCTPNGSPGATCTLALGTLAPGATAAPVFAVQVDATLPANPGNLDNTACATTATAGDPPGDNCGSTSTPPGGNPDLRTSKSLASGSGEPGATLVYGLTVSNLGNRDAAGVELTETVPALATFEAGASSPGWSCSPDGSSGSTCVLSLGTIAAGASASRMFAVRLAAAFPADPPAIENTACSATTTPGDPAADNCGSVSTPPGGAPSLTLAKSLVSGSGDPGATLVYGLTLSNQGNRDAAGVELAETVPALATFLPAQSSPGWTCSPDGSAGSSCSLPLGTLAAGASGTWTFAVRLAATFPVDPPQIDNTACASTTTAGDPAGDNCSSVQTPPGGNPDLSLDKTVLSGNGEPGATLLYGLTVTNAGTRGTAGVELVETVPLLTTLLAASSSPGWTCTPDGRAGSSCRLATGNLPAGASASYIFAVQVDSVLPPNPPAIDNTACAVSAGIDDPPANDCGSTSTPPGGHPDVQVVKSVAAGDGSPGGVLVYRLVVSNVGTRNAQGVELMETVPGLTSFLEDGSSPGWSCLPDDGAGSSCRLGLGDLAPGLSVTRTFAVQVAGTFPPSPPPILNTACARTATGGDPADNDCASTSTPPGGGPDLVVGKALTSGEVAPNALLLFTLTLHNRGTREATAVVLQETVPASSTFEPASSSPGWTCSPDAGSGSGCTLVLGTVEAGATSSHAFAVRLRPDLPAGASIANTACAGQAPGTNDPEGNDCATVVIDPPGPSTRTDVEVEIAVESLRLPPGSTPRFILTLRNTSPVPAQNLRVRVTLPGFGTEPTELDPACRLLGPAEIECSLPTLPEGSSLAFTWKHQAPLQLGPHLVTAELTEASPEDIDSTPGNGVETEDDYSQVSFAVGTAPGAPHEIPTLSELGLGLMAVVLMLLGGLFLRRGGLRKTARA